jgi:acyl carrier protein
MNKIKTDINEFIVRFAGSVELNGNDNFFELGIVNSLFAMQLIAYLEEKYSICISNDEIKLENFSSINAILALLESKNVTAVES